MNLFDDKLTVVNVGLASFAAPIAQAGGAVVDLDWQPPAAGDADIGRRLAALINAPQIEQANARAFKAYLDAAPVLDGIARARDTIPEMRERLILHAGPPVAWENMCGPMQGAIVGAILYEGWAPSPQAAEKLAGSGEIAFAPCHHHGAVGPMAGIVSPSMVGWSVTTGRKRTWSTLNEGLGKVLRYGANGPDVIERLKWMEHVLAPALGDALGAGGGIEVKPLIAQSVHMGDELHNRNGAATSLLLKRLLPALLAARPSAELVPIVRFITGNDHFFLNIAMAACKGMLDTAHGVTASSMVTVMARNGVEFGVRLSGTGDKWFTAPAARVKGLYFPGYGPDDANPDVGDSAITETAGLGGFAMAAAPAIVAFVGGTPAEAIENTRRMRRITLGENPAFTIPALGFAGTPAGIDARKVVDRNIAPVINTGIAHRLPGIGQVGAGITYAPMPCFAEGVAALAEMIGPR